VVNGVEHGPSCIAEGSRTADDWDKVQEELDTRVVPHADFAISSEDVLYNFLPVQTLVRADGKRSPNFHGYAVWANIEKAKQVEDLMVRTIRGGASPVDILYTYNWIMRPANVRTTPHQDFITYGGNHVSFYQNQVTYLIQGVPTDLDLASHVASDLLDEHGREAG